MSGPTLTLLFYLFLSSQLFWSVAGKGHDDDDDDDTPQVVYKDGLYGVADAFSRYNSEPLPSSPTLTCDEFDWQGVNGFEGDKKKMEEENFDSTKYNSPIAFTVPGFPTNERIEQMTIEMKIRGLEKLASNDGLGFFWDDTVTKYCRVSWFKTFASFPGLSTYGKDYVGTFKWEFTDFTIGTGASAFSFFEKIQKTGYFHFLVGDDTSVDYVKFSYTTVRVVSDNLVSFRCYPYSTSVSQTINTGTRPFCDKHSTTIANVTDSTSKSFRGAQLVQTSTLDKKERESAFKMKIDASTRFWVFVDSEEPKKEWLTEGGWTACGGNVRVTDSETNTAKTYTPYTKKYSGARWVVFGKGCHNSGAEAETMYFVAHKKEADTQFAITSNPAASCSCQSTGDPHYVTFDSSRYDLYTPGTYHLVKARDCSFDVQTYTYRYGSSVTVNGIVGVRYIDDVVTLTRTPAPTGQAWTGYPKARVNGVEVGGSTTVGGLALTKLDSNTWKIEIANAGLTVKAQASGNWFHIYVDLTDPDLQKRVDGLCGNCDGNVKNDHKHPDCSTVVTGTTSKLSLSDATRWGTLWKVNPEELFAASSELGLANGDDLHFECKANPITQQCPDLVPPEPPQSDTPVSDPLPPRDFVKCDGDDVVTVVGQTPPPDNEVPPEPRLCSDRPDYKQIVDKCIECAERGGTPTAECIVDICESDLETYACPEPPETPCVPATIKGSTIEGLYEWATLGDGTLEGTPSASFCEANRWRLPEGWEVAPNDHGDSANHPIVSAHNWQAYCITTSDGRAFRTKAVNGDDDCPSVGNLIKSTDGCFTTNFCNTRILIRKRLEPECGNGVREADEECDDGNNEAGDGCDSLCREEETHYCSDLTGECSLILNIVEDERHECDNDLCLGCIVTAENRDWPFCCICELPCCE